MSEEIAISGWRTGSVGELADFVRGVTYKRAQGSSKPSDGHVPLLRATNIVEGKIVEEDLVYVPSSVVSPSQVLKDGDLLLATSSGSLTVVGKSAPVRGMTNTCFGAFCGVLRPKRGTNQQFLQRFIQSQLVRDLWSSAARGTNINNLKPTTILQTPMPIPPPEEQDKIVEILEEQLSRLDAAVKSVQTVREKAAQFRRSLLHAAFTGALTQRDLGRMSEEIAISGWRTGSVGELADFVRGVTYKRAQGSSNPSDGHVPLLRATNIVEGKIVEEDLVYVPSSVVSPSQVLKDGDLLLATSSGSLTVVGKSAPVRGMTNTCFGAFCGVLRPKRGTNQQFLQRFIQSQSVRDSWSSAARGTNINNLKPTTILQTPMLIPPPDEQERIVEILEEQLSRLDATLAVADEVERKSNALRRSLLHAAFTGELTRSWREAHV